MLNKRYLIYIIGVIGILFLILIFFGISRSKFNVAKKPVTLNVASAAEIHAECESKPQPSEIYDCYAVNFETVMKAFGGKTTLTLLDELQKMGGYVQSNCHPLSHEVGHIALHVYGTIPKASPEYIPVCSSGYYHGLLEEFLATASSYESGIREACGVKKDLVFFNWFQCTHGLGHGIMQFRTDEVPQSLKDCDLLESDTQASEICYGGVFMENITTEEKTGHKSKYIKKEDPIYPCDAVLEKYKSACYFLSSSLILKLNGYNFAEAFKTCDTAEEKYHYLCFQSLGRDVSGSSLRDKQKVKPLCLLGTNKTANDNCYFGAVRDFINEKGEFDSALELCAFIDNEYKPRCYEGIFTDLGFYKRGKDFLTVCARMEEPYRSDCRRRVVN